MSAEALEHHHHSASADPHQHVAHQFEERPQQDESYIVGMWTFLVTEIMFFGALFLAYAIYRSQYPTEVAAASHELSVNWGFVNTLILLTSSLTMAFGVRAAIMKNRNMQLCWIGATILLAGGFLVVKTIEYGTKFEHHLFPASADFQWPPHAEGEGVAAGGEHGAAGGHAAATAHTMQKATPDSGASFVSRMSSDEITRGRARLYLGLYFIMTGLHGFHVIIGILVLGTIWFMIAFNHKSVQDFIPIEMAGLYWHFVDIVWIFLYPLLYLIHPKPLW